MWRYYYKNIRNGEKIHLLTVSFETSKELPKLSEFLEFSEISLPSALKQQ
jgi:hypothetical protein